MVPVRVVVGRGAVFGPTWRSDGLRRSIGAVGLLAALAVVGFGSCSDAPKVAYRELLDKDAVVRADAATRLGQAKSKEAVDSLIAVLDDDTEEVRVAAMLALGQIGDARAISAIASHASDPSSAVRVALCQALGQMGDPAGVEPLATVMHDADEHVRLVAARQLGRIRDPKALQALTDIALQDPDEMVRQHVIKVLGEREARDAVPLVEAALEAESDKVRANAAQVLGQIGDPSSLPALIRALEDPYFKVRALAAHSLQTIAPSDPGAMAAMRARLEHETDGLAIVNIAWNLARSGDRSQVGKIRDLLFRGDPEDVRAEAARALGEVGDASDVPLLQRALDDKRGLVRRQAHLALQKLKEA